MSAVEKTMVDRVPDRLKRKGRVWDLEVTATETVTPTMWRVLATGPDLQDFTYRPGQSLILVLPQENGEVAARHYTIRWFDAATVTLAIDVALHGDRSSPANRWALGARAGDRFAAVGPRGHVVLDDEAAEHLIVVDETGLPAALSILEALPNGATATAFIEVATMDSRQEAPSSSNAELRWFVRADGEAPGQPSLDALRERDWNGSNERVHVYLAGETSAVREQRRLLLERKISKSAISAEGYWRPDRRGGHDHIDD